MTTSEIQSPQPAPMPCPFCGSDDLSFFAGSPIRSAAIICNDCACDMPGADHADALASWNRRFQAPEGEPGDLPALPVEFSRFKHEAGVPLYSAAQMQSYARAALAAQPQPETWAGAAAFIQHTQSAAGAPGHWVDEYLAWYSPIDWLGEHRAAAVFLGQKIGLLNDVAETLRGQRADLQALCDERGRKLYGDEDQAPAEGDADALIEELEDAAKTHEAGPTRYTLNRLEAARAALASKVQPKGTPAGWSFERAGDVIKATAPDGIYWCVVRDDLAREDKIGAFFWTLCDAIAPAPKGLTSVCHMECDGCIDAGKCAFPGKAAEPARYPHPDEDDAVTLWAEIHRLRAAVQGPDGYATWQEAATAERVRRVAAEKAMSAVPSPAVGAEPVAWVVWAENGNCIMWSTSKSAAEDVAKNYGRPLTALYATPPDHTVAMTEAAEAIESLLSLIRRHAPELSGKVIGWAERDLAALRAIVGPKPPAGAKPVAAKCLVPPAGQKCECADGSKLCPRSVGNTTADATQAAASHVSVQGTAP